MATSLKSSNTTTTTCHGNNNEREDDEKEEDLHLQIQDLQRRLSRRNALLDVVRKAYHQDVLIIREYLLKLKAGESLDSILASTGKYSTVANSRHGSTHTTGGTVNGDITISLLANKNYNNASSSKKTPSSFPEQQSSVGGLSCIPSIDLRHTGLHLFAPEECELRLKPCSHCGGTLELVHRESSRISSLLQTGDNLRDEVADLECKLSEARNDIQKRKNKHEQMEKETLHERQSHETEVNELNSQITNYQHIESKCDALTTEMKQFDAVRQERDAARLKIIEVERRLEESIQDKYALNKVIEDTNDSIDILRMEHDAVCQREKSYYEELMKYKDECKSLQMSLKEEKQDNRNLQSQIDSCNEENTKLKQEIDKLHDNESQLSMKISDMTMERDTLITKMDALRQQSTTTIERLETQIRTKDQEMKDCQKEWEGKNARMQQSFNLQHAQDSKTIQGLESTVEMLSTLSTSYIRGLYEYCLTQESIIQSEENRTGTTIANNSYVAPSSTNTTPKNNPQLHIVIESLEKKLDSNHIDWDNILHLESIRRQIFGHLNNRAQINLSTIEKLMEKVYTRHVSIVKRLERKEVDSLNKLCQEHDQEVARMQLNCKLLEEEICNLSMQWETSKGEVEELNEHLAQVNKDNEGLNQDVMNLKQQVSRGGERQSQLEKDLETKQQKLQEAEASLKEKEVEIESKDAAFSHLEFIFQKSTSRYVAKIEEEKKRREESKSIDIQASPPVMNVAQQVNFVSIAPPSSSSHHQMIRHIHPIKSPDNEMNSKVARGRLFQYGDDDDDNAKEIE